MRCTVAALAFSAVLASAAASFTGLPGGPQPAPSPDEAVFLVPTSDGYGVAECLTSGSECGQVVADAWCATQGYARAIGFGRVAPEDVTGSLQRISSAQRTGQPVAVTCAK
jgi:hypothetical protein